MTGQLKLQGPVAGNPVIQLGAYQLGPLGYVMEEYFLSGTAASYSQAGERGGDGKWQVKPAQTAPFTTRLVVCRPADASRFNGTVLVEWLNVSGGLDAPPDWYMMHRHILREGMAWVGVSAQIVGIEGGAALGPGIPLKQANQQRYALLSHPGDAYAFDIFTHAGRAVRAAAGSGILGPLAAQRIIAAGASQSAIFLVTYVNAIDHSARLYDGFLIHGRGGTGVPLSGNFLSGRSSVNLTGSEPLFAGADHIRADVRVPVLTIQSETDVIKLGGIGARQPDSDRIRLWEVAGAAHFDAYGLIASQLDDGSLSPARFAELNAPISEIVGMPTDAPINAGPQFHYVIQAALAALERWVGQGTLPPPAPRLEDGAQPLRLALDEHGNAKGGIRTPWVDAPTAALSGLGQGGGGFGFLFGTTRPFDDAKLASMYPGGRREYLARFEGSAQSAVRAGFLLASDLEEIKALAAAACPMR
ncbi:MAG TPA: alpha/beta hydrolase domain-containing protein [Candidatus Binataceae bacterium]|nr:alpha/beta hydrolase domain-containing protein [Candidatus Binataceae bacterium]